MVGESRKIGNLIARFDNNSAHEMTQIDSEAPQLTYTPNKEGKRAKSIADATDMKDSTSLVGPSPKPIDFNLYAIETQISERMTKSEMDSKNICHNTFSCSNSSSTSSSCASYESL